MNGWELAWWILVAAIVYTLVRPGSPTGEVIKAMSELTSGLVGVATGAAFVTTNNQKGSRS